LTLHTLTVCPSVEEGIRRIFWKGRMLTAPCKVVSPLPSFSDLAAHVFTYWPGKGKTTIAMATKKNAATK